MNRQRTRAQAIYRRAVPLTWRVGRRELVQDTRARWVGRSDPSVAHQRDLLRELRGTRKGERCFLVGNGPSLNEMDLDAFSGEVMWTSNRASLLFERVAWRPQFHVAVDTVVVPDNADELQDLAATLAGTLFFYPRAFRLNGTLRSAPNIRWLRERYVEIPHATAEQAFSTDVADHVVTAATVTVTMLQLAVWLGFNPIYLIGCDTSYVVDDDVEELDNEELVSTRDADRNHFDPTYFGQGKRWHQPNVHKMIRHYQLSKTICDGLGVRVVNATVGGRLEVFPREDHRDVLGR